MPEGIGYGGLFGAAGFDPRTEEEILRMRQLERYTQQLQATQGQYARAHPSEQTAATLGTQVGAALGNRFMPPQLSPEEQRQQAIQDAGKEMFAARIAEAHNEGRELSLEDQNAMLYNSMARAALEAGDMNAFSAIAEQAQRISMENQINRANLRKLEGDLEPIPRTEQIREIGTDVWSATQRQASKDEFTNAQAYNGVIEGVSQAFEDIIALGEDPTLITRIPGGVTSAINDAISVVRQLPSIVGNVVEGGERTQEGTIDGGTTLSMDDMLERFHVEIPDVIAGARERALYKSLMIQLAYQQWRAEEGSGARQASDQDIDRSLAAIGATSNDARVVASVLGQNHARGANRLANKLRQEYIVGQSVGLTPQEVNEFLFGMTTDNWTEYTDRFQTSQERLARIARLPVNQPQTPQQPSTSQGATIRFLD